MFCTKSEGAALHIEGCSRVEMKNEKVQEKKL